MACNTCGNDAGEAISFGDAGVERRCNHCNYRTDMGPRAASAQPTGAPTPRTFADDAVLEIANPAGMLSDAEILAAIEARLTYLGGVISAGETAQRENRRLCRLRAVLTADCANSDMTRETPWPEVVPIHRSREGAA